MGFTLSFRHTRASCCPSAIAVLLPSPSPSHHRLLASLLLVPPHLPADPHGPAALAGPSGYLDVDFSELDLSPGCRTLPYADAGHQDPHTSSTDSDVDDTSFLGRGLGLSISRLVKSGTEALMGSPAAKAKVAASIFEGTPEGELPGLKEIADLLKSGKAKNVVIMAGAGISTSAGIPDFRSPETGLYANLEKYELPDPQAIFEIEYFKERPEAFFALAKELYPGNFEPTPTHYFFKLLADKGVLKSVQTQNIDTLERAAGLDDDYVIEAHGSFAEAACLRCGANYSAESIKEQIMLGEVVRCRKEACVGRREALVKPKIVFFGEGLPDKFFNRMTDLYEADLLIVLGTSLTVHPFAGLMHKVRTKCPRLLINLESVGEIPIARGKFAFSTRASAEGFDFEGRKGPVRDVRWLGKTDDGVKELAKLCGWEEELAALCEKRSPQADLKTPAKAKAEKVAGKIDAAAKATSAAEEKDDPVDALRKQVEKVELSEKEEPSSPSKPSKPAAAVDGEQDEKKAAL